MIKGRAWNYGDNINTDFILPGRYLELTNPKEIAKHAFEGIDPNFINKVKNGDVIIGGKNFGLGSSREHAPIALKYSGIGAVVSESFARIFYRNSINLGLPVLECKNISKHVKNGDIIEIDLDKGILKINNDKTMKFQPIPSFMQKILDAGGLRKYIIENRKEW